MTQDKPSLVKKEYLLPFVLITSLFFMWGFARSILDLLNKHFQDTMEMTKAASSLIQVMVYSAYFLMAVPAGLYINRFGYRRGVVAGLSLFGIGALMFIPGERLMSFRIFLGALFVLGCGLVILETAANPYAASLGDPRTGASRLNLAQSFNGLGCIFGPLIVGQILFTEGGESSVALPYTVMGIVVLCIAAVFSRVNLPEISNANADIGQNVSITELWRRGRFVFGLIALFAYEISEISINSFFINYVTEDGHTSAAEASVLLSICGLGLFFLGRLLGSVVMSRVRAESVLTVCGAGAVVCTILIIVYAGVMSRIALYCCYAFESIMFPTIFALSVKDLGALTKRASSFLMMTPIGGAVGAFLMGNAADAMGMAPAFAVPCAGYCVVLAYALFIRKKH
ncbi:MAG: MFS transporter [Muribaculaceae bacterium]|nr:MFS transporter [Muribaculaceae bacterium]